jgi:hypothetical protein
MVKHGLPMNEDHILPNRTNIDTIEKSNKDIPFKGRQNMHVSTLRTLIHLYNPFGSLVVTLNSLTSMSS